MADACLSGRRLRPSVRSGSLSCRRGFRRRRWLVRALSAAAAESGGDTLEGRLGRLEALAAGRRVYRDVLQAEEMLELVAGGLPLPSSRDGDGKGGAGGVEWSLPLPTFGVVEDGRGNFDKGKGGDVAITAEGGWGVVSGKGAVQPQGELELGGDWPLLETLLDTVEEMQSLATRLRIDLRVMQEEDNFCKIFRKEKYLSSTEPDAKEAEQRVNECVELEAMKLRFSMAEMLADLPFASAAEARGVLEQCKERGMIVSRPGGSRDLRKSLLRLNKARAGVVAKFTGRYVKNVWMRLNGSGLDSATLGAALEEVKLPKLPSTKATCEERIEMFKKEIATLERDLQGANRRREILLRGTKGGPLARAKLAGEIREKDELVSALRRSLSVKLLQLELEKIYVALEEEAIEVSVADGIRSDEELQVFIAEMGESATKLITLQDFAKEEPLLIDDMELADLAFEVSDLKARLGLQDDDLYLRLDFGFYGQTIMKSIVDVRVKLADGFVFFIRSFRLLGSDVSQSGRLIWKALNGTTLKLREVRQLRRTARDILVFIPLGIIFIVPLTPVGHVAVFTFIQKYFPGVFPSQFSSKRQELMLRYAEIKRQMRENEEQAEIEAEEEELRETAKTLAALRSEKRGEESASNQFREKKPSSRRKKMAQ